MAQLSIAEYLLSYRDAQNALDKAESKLGALAQGGDFEAIAFLHDLEAERTRLRNEAQVFMDEHRNPTNPPSQKILRQSQIIVQAASQAVAAAQRATDIFNAVTTLVSAWGNLNNPTDDSALSTPSVAVKITAARWLALHKVGDQATSNI